MCKLTLNPHNPNGPLWLVWMDLTTGETLFLAEVM